MMRTFAQSPHCDGPHCSQATLQAVSRASPPVAGTCEVALAVMLEPISTPLIADAWAEALCHHPDQLFVADLLDGIRHEFRIRLVPSKDCRSKSQNSPSAMEHRDIVT